MFDTLHGSVAYQGAQDVLWVMEHQQVGWGVLQVRGKDAKNCAFRVALVEGHWKYMGDGEESKVSREPKATRLLLRIENRPLSPAERLQLLLPLFSALFFQGRIMTAYPVALMCVPFETQNFSKYRPTSNLGHKPKAKLQGFCRAEAIQNQNSWFHLGFTLGCARLSPVKRGPMATAMEIETEKLVIRRFPGLMAWADV